MQIDFRTWEILSARVEKLERQNRRMRCGGALVLIVLTSAFVMAQVKNAKMAPPKAVKSVEAGKFILQDGRGAKRAELGLFADRPVLVFYDDASNPALSVGVESEGTGLTIYDNQSEKAVAVNYGANGPVLSLFNRGMKRLNLSVTGQGPAVGLLGRKGEAKAALGLTAEDSSFLHLFGQGERGGAQLLAAPDRTVLRFFDPSDKARAVLGIVDKDADPGLVLNDSGGNSRAIMMLTPEGPGVELFDKNHMRIWSAK
jgi:hypothetical protein